MSKLTPDERRELLEFVSSEDSEPSWVEKRMALPAPHFADADTPVVHDDDGTPVPTRRTAGDPDPASASVDWLSDLLMTHWWGTRSVIAELADSDRSGTVTFRLYEDEE